MIFYLGTHLPTWLSRAGVPLFVSRRRLVGYKTLPRAVNNWALDSGGFTELSMFGGWTVAPRQYATEVRRFRDEIGQMDFAAPQDWMCEPFIVAKTGRSVRAHQQLTLDNYEELLALAPDLPWLPVLQGWEIDDYLRHADAYRARGHDIEYVGVGSVCRRQATTEIAALAEKLVAAGLQLHGFGVKTRGLSRYGRFMRSADSLAWSFAARRSAPLDGCVGHKNCANCMRYALRWRDALAA